MRPLITLFALLFSTAWALADLTDADKQHAKDFNAAHSALSALAMMMRRPTCWPCQLVNDSSVRARKPAAPTP